MTETSNYALNIVEGSDLFNPLTQFNPNFEQIDTVMAENEQAGVGTATELKSGTTHAIIRENNNRSMFYFTATSDYEAGDTFTVDGAVVTAKLVTGESLGAGAFVVNSTVLCSIVGSLLTVYSSKGGVTTAADSERLGGELPAYYATAEELLATDAKADSAGSVAQSANAISIQNQTAIQKLNGVFIRPRSDAPNKGEYSFNGENWINFSSGYAQKSGSLSIPTRGVTTIDTGLKNIKSLIIYSSGYPSSLDSQTYTSYDSAISDTTYICAFNLYSANRLEIGVGDVERCLQIISISNGEVTIKNSIYQTNLNWVAYGEE